MPIDQLNWDAPVMLEDGTWARKGINRWSDWWVEYWDADEQLIKNAIFTSKGTHSRYKHEPKLLPRVVNRPAVDMRGALYWLDTGDRAFVRKTQFCTITGDARAYLVDDPAGHIYYISVDSKVVHLPPRLLGNVPEDNLAAEARIAIKRAQAERAKRREQAALDQLANLNPTLFGSF